MSEIYNKIISFESLYNAHLKTRRNKRHKDEVINFEIDLETNLLILHNKLKYKRYLTSGYHMFKIYDPKERIIQAITYKDRIVQRSICDNYLTPLLEKHFIYDNCACRKNKGTSFAFKRLRMFMSKYYRKYGNKGYFVKIDVHKYFDSINHAILKDKLRRIIDDKDILDLLFIIIDSYNKDSDMGLPMGNQTSQSFALLYLDELDRYYKERLRIKYYIRYMDDIILLVHEKELVKEILVIAENIFKKNRLCINPKSQIINIKQGIKFLGWIFSFANNGKIIQKISQGTKKRIVKKIKNKNEYEIKESLISYRGFLLMGNGYHLYERIKKIKQ